MKMIRVCFISRVSRMISCLSVYLCPATLNIYSTQAAPLTTEQRTWYVALDPGHGGQNYGAIDPRIEGRYEKHYTLQIARIVQEHLKAAGVKVWLSRTRDEPHSLRDRIRRASAAGVDAVVLADPAIEPFGPNVIRNATGALFEVPLIVASTQELLPTLKLAGFTTYITNLHDRAKSMFDIKWPEKSAIVLGEESQGLSDSWNPGELTNIIIPMEGDTIDSLNVSVSAAVLMYHWKSQQ